MLSLTFRVLLGILPLTSIWLTNLLVNEVVSVIQNQTDIRFALYLLLGQLVLFGVGYLIGQVAKINDQHLDNLVNFYMTHTLLKKVDRLPYLTFENPIFYDKYQRVSNSSSNVMSIVQEVLSLGSSLITIFSLIGYLFSIHWSFIVLLLITTIPILMIDVKFGGMRYQLLRFLTPMGRRESYVSNLLNNKFTFKEVRLYGLAPFLIGEWAKLFRINASEQMNLMKREVRWSSIGEVLLLIAYSASGVITLLLGMQGRIRVGDFIAVLQAMENVQKGLSNSTSTISRLYEKSLNIQDLKEFLQAEEQVVGKQEAQVQRIDSIVVDQLCFRYPNQEHAVIQDIDLHITAGKKIAIVGENGSGKTTLIKCLTGLYNTEPQMIQVNGEPLQVVDRRSYQDRIAVLFQDYAKYEFSARYNIGFGRVEDVDNLVGIQHAAAQTNIHDYLDSLDEKYESLLGRSFDGGNELSLGQWQKVALARTVFRNSDLIILDEPTAALDPRSEVEIIDNLFRLATNQSILFITHRLGAASLADEVVVMKNGRIVEQGTHAQLLTLDGEYAKLYNSQAKWYNNPQETAQEQESDHYEQEEEVLT
ncbi:ABC transporter ATP-binding protein [Tumebacillus lipolyticus]|uniref:ABC transporter ATP-binding protein n=1 Tax=Tumebacillus lipolyticus TaxID=1280370 RepID=A0ABW4ZWZ0_9BACL